MQFRGAKQGISGRLICSISPDGRFVLLQGILENRTGKNILFDKMVLLESIDVEWKRHTLVTPLLDVVPAYPLEEQTGWNLHTDAAAFYPPEGDGILIGTTGTGTAYLKINVKQDFLQVYSDMEQIVVSDGETRVSEQAILLCGDSESCVAEWAAVVGRAQNARLHRYSDCVREFQTSTDCLLFQHSFKLGARMMLEVME